MRHTILVAFDRTNFEDNMIADMRSHGGEVTTGPLAGHPLLVLTTVGARTGEPRRAILTASRDGEDYIVAGTAGGSQVAPGWVHNVQARPDVTIEVGNRVTPATTIVELDGDERDRLWDQHVAQLPHFADYPAKTGRVIPMVRLTPRD